MPASPAPYDTSRIGGRLSANISYLHATRLRVASCSTPLKRITVDQNVDDRFHQNVQWHRLRSPTSVSWARLRLAWRTLAAQKVFRLQDSSILLGAVPTRCLGRAQRSLLPLTIGRHGTSGRAWAGDALAAFVCVDRETSFPHCHGSTRFPRPSNQS